MVHQTISSRDLEKLSAYLDEELRPSERRRLEMRLQREPGLQAELESFRQTRAMLRSLPRPRAPRNFTLTPAMVGVTRQRSWQPVFGFASALAIVLLVLVVVGDFLVIPGYVGMFPVNRAPSLAANPSMSQETGSEAKEEALVFPTEAPTQAATDTPMLELPAAKIFQQGQGTPTPLSSLDTGVAADSQERTAPEAPPIVGAAPLTSQDALATEESVSQTPTISTTPTLAQTLVYTNTLEVQALPTNELADANQAKESHPVPEAETGPMGFNSPRESGGQASGLWIQVALWMVELFLACLAIAAGLVSLYLWYTNRHSVK